MGVVKTKKRQKLCHNCDGDVDLDVIVCPFCAADLREERPEQTIRSPYLSSSITPEPPPKEEASASSLEEESSSPVMPLLLGSLGCQLFLFGFFLLFFSHDGELVFRWDATKWSLYVLLSLPALFFGYRAWKKIGPSK